MLPSRTIRKLTECGVALTAVATLILAGCGGGGSAPGAGLTPVASTSSIITPFKGRFTSGNVSLVDANGNPVTLSAGGSINASGVASVTYPASVSYPLTVNVSGTYLDETGGVGASATIAAGSPLQGIIPSAADAVSGVPVTAVTHMARSMLPATGLSAASAVAAITGAASAVLGVPSYAQAMLPPVFDANGKTTDINTLKLAALARVIGQHANGADINAKLHDIAAKLAAGSAVNAVIPQGAYQNAVTAVNSSGASGMLPTGFAPPTIPSHTLSANGLDLSILGTIPMCATGQVLQTSATGLNCVGGSPGGGGACVDTLGADIFRLVDVNGTDISGIFTTPPSFSVGSQLTLHITTLTNPNPSSYTVAFDTASTPIIVPVSAVNLASSTLTVAIPQGATGGIRITDTCANNETYSNRAFQISPTPSLPATPTGVMATAVSSAQISLSWTALTGATGYNVYRSTAQGGTLTASNKITATPITLASFNDTGLSAATTYYYIVTAVNAAGEGAGAAEVSASTAGGITPPPIKRWTPQINNGGMTAIAASPTLYVGVGDNGLIKTSPDGITWTLRASGTMETLRAITWSGTQFVAVGGDGMSWTSTPTITVSTGVILTSPDGISWTKQNSGIPSSGVTAGPGYTNSSINLNGVSFGGGTYVAVGYSNIGSPVVLTSTDGFNWSWRSISNGSGLVGVAWSGSQFIAIGNSCSNGCASITTGNNIFTSPDGITWTQRLSGVLTGLKSVSCSTTNCVAVGQSNTISPVVLNSSDGITWTSVVPAGYTASYSGGLTSVTWSGTQFVAAGFLSLNTMGNATGILLASADGSTWTSKAFPIAIVKQGNPGLPASYNPIVSFANGQYIIALGTQIGRSSDAITWSAHAAGDGAVFSTNKVIFANGKFVATQTIIDSSTGNTDARIATSTDGINWSNSPITGVGIRSQLMGGVTWSGTQFLAIGLANFLSGDAYVATSPDGVTWTAAIRTTLSSNRVNDVAYGNGIYVAVGGQISTSTDGITWTPNATANNTRLVLGYPLQSVKFVNGQFVAVGQGLGNGNNQSLIFTSTDGLTWNKVTVSTASITGLKGVAFGNGKFVTLSGYASGQGVGAFATSSDAISWTKVGVATGGSVPAAFDIEFGDGAFISVGSQYGASMGYGRGMGYISTSADGLNWGTNIVSAEPINGVALGNGIFLAVGGRGVVYTSPILP